MWRRASSERAVLAWILSIARALFAGAGEPGREVDRIWVYWRRGLGFKDGLHTVRIPVFPPGQDEGLPGRVSRTGVAIHCQNVRDDEFFSPFYEPIFLDTYSQWCLPLFPALHLDDSHYPWLGFDDPRPVLCLESTHGEIDPALRSRGDLISLLGGLRYAVWAGFQKLSSAASDETQRWRLERQLQEVAGLQPEPTVRRLFDLLVRTFEAKGLSYWQYDRDEDSFCHPIFSKSQKHRLYPRPGPWGIVGRVLAKERAEWVENVETANELRPSQFVSAEEIKATAYVPARRSPEAAAGRSRPVEGILFVNYEQEHHFGAVEKKILTATAEAVASVLALRSRARRHQRHRYDLEDTLGEPPSPQRALDSVLTALSELTGYSHALLYERDRPGSVLVRTRAVGKLRDEFRGRYLESHPLLSHLGESTAPLVLHDREIQQRASAPAAFVRGELRVVPLRRGDDLLGICLLAHQEPPSQESGLARTLTQFQEVLVSLLELGLQVHGLRRSAALLDRFLRSSEREERAALLAPLVTAYLDALLEESTADGCCVLLARTADEPEAGRFQPQVPGVEAFSRGDIGGLRLTRMPPVCEQVLTTGRAKFDDRDPLPTDTATGHPDVRSHAILPLLSSDQRLGVLAVEYHAEHRFTPEDRWFFQVLAHLLGEALHELRARKVLFDRVRSLAESGARIAQLGSPDFKRRVPLDDEALQLALQARNFSQADFVDLYVLQGDGLFLQATGGGPLTLPEREAVEGRRLDSTVGLVGRAVHTRRTIIEPDTLSNAAVERGYIPNIAFEGTRSELIVPVRDGDDVIAVINLESRRVDAFNEEDGRFVEAVAAQAVALRRAAELQNVRRQLQEERDLLVHINTIALAAEHEPQADVLERILLTLGHDLQGESLAIHLLGLEGASFDAVRSVRVPPIAPPLLTDRTEALLLTAVAQARQHPESDYVRVLSATEEDPARLIAALGRGNDVLGVLHVTSQDVTALEQQIELVRAAILGICNALELAADADRKATAEFLQNMLRKDADDLLQVLTSTIFHDSPQLIEGLVNSHAVLKQIYIEDGRRLPETWARIEKILARLGRLIVALPKYDRPSRVDLMDIVHRTFDPSNRSLLAYHDRIRCKLRVEAATPPSPLYIIESETWLSHILENLATNAFRAMAESGTPEPRLTVRAFARHGKAVVQVEDNGPGMPPSLVESIGKARIEHKDTPEKLGIFHLFAGQHLRRQGGDLLLARNAQGCCMFELCYPLNVVPQEESHGTKHV